MDKKIINIEEFKERLLVLLKTEAFRKGNFVLSSGKTSNFYLDGRVLTLTPEGVYLAAYIILDMVKDKGIHAIGGPTLGADPIVGAIGAISHIENIPLKTFIVRKHAKGHGMQKQIEGPELVRGSRVVIIDDVATSGKSLLEAKEALDNAGVSIEEAIVLVDRQEGAQQNLSQAGVRFRSIFTIQDLDK
ncbi:MAG: orotate phosphoribosyltransferase [Candidatus Omnitrophota bacterium]|nr:orotate phosphoribosyltransferase [Candidatus Omnitrophota bacterium]